jgi:hypothetical protein
LENEAELVDDTEREKVEVESVVVVVVVEVASLLHFSTAL